MIIRGRSYNVPINRDIVASGEPGVFYGIHQGDRRKLILNRYGVVELFQTSQITRMSSSKVHDEFEFPADVPAEDSCLAYTIFQATNILATRLINRLSVKYEQCTSDYYMDIQRVGNTDVAQLYIVLKNKFGLCVCEASYVIVKLVGRLPNRPDQSVMEIK